MEQMSLIAGLGLGYVVLKDGGVFSPPFVFLRTSFAASSAESPNLFSFGFDFHVALQGCGYSF